MTDDSKFIYPINGTPEEIIAFHEMIGKLDKSECLKGAPKDLTLRTSEKENLVIVGSGNLNSTIAIKFPLGYYKVACWIKEENDIERYSKTVNKINDFYLLKITNAAWIDEFIATHKIKKDRIIVPEIIKFDNGWALKVHFGICNEKTPTIVVFPRTTGLFNIFLLAYRCAENHDSDVVPDWQDFNNTCMEARCMGLYDPWPYYFKPLSKKTLDDAYHNNLVILTSGPDSFESLTNFNYNSFSIRIRESANIQYEKIFKKAEGKKVLGVFVRGTDYYTAVYHPHPLDSYEIVQVIREHLEKYSLDYVFLYTEDSDIFETVVSVFGKKVLFIDKERFSHNKITYDLGNPASWLPNVVKHSNFSCLLNNDNYIIDTLLLTKCDAILTGAGTASELASILTSKKELLFFKRTLSKGPNGTFGEFPIQVISHNKNLLKLSAGVKKPNCVFTDMHSAVHIRGKFAKGVQKLSISELTALEANTDYCLSGISRSNLPYGFSLILSNVASSYEIESNGIIRLENDCNSAELLLIVDEDCEINDCLKLQIEKGKTTTDYEEPAACVTKIALMDDTGILYDGRYLECADFKTGKFSIFGKVKNLDSNQYLRYKKIIRFPNGSLTYAINGHDFCSLDKNRLQKHHLTGLIFPDVVDIKSAIHYVRKSPWSFVTLSTQILKGFLHSRDQTLREIAITLLKSENRADYATVLSNAYTEGLSVPADQVLADKWANKVIEFLPKYWNSGEFYATWKESNSNVREKLVRYLIERANAGETDAMGHLGRAYRDGEGVPKDLNKAAEWMRKARAQGIKWADWELFGILWQIDTPESMKEAIGFGMPLAESGVREMQGWIARSYRDGRGVPKDLDKAAEWMRKAFRQELWYSGRELIDILLRIGTGKSYREMIEVATKSAASGNGDAMGRLGRAYRDGKGAPKDLDKAAEWMRKAREKNVKWADWELFGILWQIDTPESIKEALSFGMPLAESGVKEMQGWIARAYRDGKGVPKDLNKAAGWMRKAYRQELWYASWELFDILYTIDTPESLSEAISIAKPLAESGKRELQSRMGQAYHDGKGVPKDLKKAAEWKNKSMI